MQSQKDDMTPAQRDAICKAYSSMGEQFESVLIVVNFEVEDEEGERAEAHEGYWKGGAMAALGLARFAEDRILHGNRRQNEP